MDDRLCLLGIQFRCESRLDEVVSGVDSGFLSAWGLLGQAVYWRSAKATLKLLAWDDMNEVNLISRPATSRIAILLVLKSLRFLLHLRHICVGIRGICSCESPTDSLSLLLTSLKSKPGSIT